MLRAIFLKKPKFVCFDYEFDLYLFIDDFNDVINEMACKCNVKHFQMVDSLVRCGFEANELVSALLEASCLTTYIPVLCWEMVQTAPLLMDSTPKCWDEKVRCLYYVFSWSFGGVGLTWML